MDMMVTATVRARCEMRQTSRKYLDRYWSSEESRLFGVSRAENHSILQVASISSRLTHDSDGFIMCLG
jgi:hypothetical protein